MKSEEKSKTKTYEEKATRIRFGGIKKATWLFGREAGSIRQKAKESESEMTLAAWGQRMKEPEFVNSFGQLLCPSDVNAGIRLAVQ